MVVIHGYDCDNHYRNYISHIEQTSYIISDNLVEICAFNSFFLFCMHSEFIETTTLNSCKLLHALKLWCLYKSAGSRY